MLDKRKQASILWLICTAVFLYLGLTQNRSVYTILGVVFLALAIVSFRGRRTP
ncbi:MAG TPA: hypothetical protein VNM67_02155 [Thermoanaerobaculia bacterium]|jgi:hypothetical protein|nr:hypothetical protein [Thermoanaerobaculia bacterium]